MLNYIIEEINFYKYITMMRYMIISKHVILKITKVGKPHRIIVLENVRRSLDLNEGDKIAWILEENKAITEKVKEHREVSI